ncbi:long-chain-fatty-acid--CoA ligase [Dactylosporangium sp. CA-139066]|uniref:long-chain-fatty-acid--CoA ligase n=1 Tax=Dactylosporangium sp. CA-139066 TaxID=3239930 RepID=UPI003D90032F
MGAQNYGRVVDVQRVRREQEPALITEGEVWTYGRLADSVGSFAAYLAEHGVGKGDRVAIEGMNSPEFVCAVLAIYRLGAVAVPLNYRLQEEELGYLLKNSGSVALLADREFVAVLARATDGFPLRAKVSLDGEEAGWDSFADIMVRYEGRSTPVAEVAAGDPQRIMYTSGTTSRPKGVTVTHGMAALNALVQLSELGLTSADRVLVSSPLYHVAAWDAPGVAVLFAGGAMVLMRKFEPATALDMMERHGVTGGIFVQAMLHGLRSASGDGRDLSRLRWVIFGAAAGELYREIREMLPTTRLVQAYGMTEACSAIAYMDEAHAVSKLGSAGSAVPFVEYRVVDENDDEVPAGVVGEIVMRGPKVTPGYWADEELTAQAWRGGWFHTGDVGMVDADGFVTITDRLKDMIRSGGENVAGQEIERVLYSHPAISEAAVIGVPDPRWQEVPKAFVVRKAGSAITEAEVIAHCRASLASFKTPKYVEFRESLPRNPSGKVLKRVLREEG